MHDEKSMTTLTRKRKVWESDEKDTVPSCGASQKNGWESSILKSRVSWFVDDESILCLILSALSLLLSFDENSFDKKYILIYSTH